MAAIPDNFSDSYFIDYSNNVSGHTMLVRGELGGTLADLDADVKSFLQALGTSVAGSTITAVRKRNANTTISFPVGSTLVGFTFGAGSTDVEHNAVAETFVGRTVEGVRSRISVFGYKGEISAYRLTPGESPIVAASVAVLNGAETVFLAKDGLQPVWTEWIDIKANDYWVRRARG